MRSRDKGGRVDGQGVRPGYKKTEVGVIPEDWEVKKLGEIAEIGSGGTPDRKNPMQLNETGQIVDDTWRWLQDQYDYVEIAVYRVMHNYLHGIIVLCNDRHERDERIARDGWEPGDGSDPRRGGSRTAPTGIPTGIPAPTPAKCKTVGRLIGAFKTVSTKQINIISKTPGEQMWQRDFYEHIIRDEEDYQRIHQYILDNPLEWEKDDLYSKEQRQWFG
ncbi:MAG TPA: hypothetical protein VHY08_08330 [Bacillota bacterium]|nr:hypothetical protein [Bacillota bacterium]